MAVTFVDSFKPQTKTGASLQGFVNAMFTGESPNDALKARALADHQRAQIRHYDAGTAKLDEETALLEMKRAALDSEDDFVSRLTGLPKPQVAAVRAHLNGDPSALAGVPEWSRGAPVADAAPALPMPTDGVPVVGAQPVVTRGKVAVHPDVRRIAEALATAQATRATQPNSPDDVAKAYRTGLDRVFSEDVLAGNIDPAEAGRRRAANEGKALVDMNGAGQVIDKFSGEPGPGNDLLASSTAENLARALTGTFHESDRGILNSKTGAFAPHAANVAGADTWVDVLVDGRKVRINSKDLSREGAQALFRRDPVEKPTKADKPRELKAAERTLAQKSIVAGLNAIEVEASGGEDGTGRGSFKIPEAIRQRVIVRAMQLASDPAEESFFANGPAALEAAIAELVPEGFDKKGNWNPLVDNTLAPRGGAAPAASPQPAAPAAPAKPTTPAAPAAKVTRPKGATDAALIDQANDAIKRGAPRDAVMRRLRDMGVRVD